MDNPSLALVLIIPNGTLSGALHPPLITLPAPKKQICRLPFALLLKAKCSFTRPNMVTMSLPPRLFAKRDGLDDRLQAHLFGLV